MLVRLRVKRSALTKYLGHDDPKARACRQARQEDVPHASDAPTLITPSSGMKIKLHKQAIL